MKRQNVRRKNKKLRYFIFKLAIFMLLVIGLTFTVNALIFGYDRYIQAKTEEKNAPMLNNGESVVVIDTNNSGVKSKANTTIVNGFTQLGSEINGNNKATEYMKGTSHNYYANKYSYETKDVRGWIANPKSYKGDKKLVFLTFDDGPSIKNTPEVLDILKKNNVPATFYILGSKMEQKGSEKILKRQIEEGHAIGYHSYSHKYEILYPNGNASEEAIVSEIDQTRNIIRNKTGIQDFSSKTFRYPGGHMSWKNINASDKAIQSKGIYDVDWNALTGDAESPKGGRGKENPLEHVKNDIKNYGNPKVIVVLMHDAKNESIPYLEQIINYFKDNGYEFGILN